VSIELDSFPANWGTEIQNSSRLEDSMEAGNSFLISVDINGISIPAQSNMFNDMEAGEGITIVYEFLV
jgi:hypothetical protein